jgi:ATP-binding cassette subfamily B protein
MAGGMWRRAGGGEASLKTQTNESHWKLLKRSAPYLWPRDALRAQAAFVGAIAVLLATNAVQLLTPFQLAHGVQRAADESAEPAETRSYSAIAVPVLAYVLLRFGSDFLVELRQYLFQVVSAETERRIALETFSHLQNLSLSFHLQRETGAVLRSVTRGAASFSTISQLLLFQIAPVFIQLIVVCIIFLVRFPWFFSVLVLVAVAVYFVVTFVAAEWRNKFRREMNTRENEYNQRAVEGLLNFETVKYFNAERHERNRVNRALVAYQKANLKSALALSTLNLGQATVIGASLAAAMLLAARQVSSGHMGVGDFVLVNQFLLTLFQPLNYLGSYYRLFKQAMIDVESMFELLGKPVDIVDVPAAPSLQVKGGHIEFDNVHFAYREERPILRGVSFVVRPGEHVAVVGKSGAGKSTLARLLYRFYDPQRGRILVDGQDVRSVTQLSLRRAIAIVPQDCVLFNDSIAYNVNYGRVGGEHAEAEEARLGPEVEPPIDQAAVETATRHAALHEFILSSQEGYRTPVGERGLRLSGGEKQRVAIARAILKAPNIIVLDEATR